MSSPSSRPEAEAACARSIWRVEANEADSEDDRDALEESAGQFVRDEVVVEAPLELRAGEAPLVMLLRTPGADGELALGLALTEGWIRDPDELSVARPDPARLVADEVGNVLELSSTTADLGRVRKRALPSVSSCGLCGKAAVAELELDAAPIGPGVIVSPAVVAALPAALRAGQPLFARTGAIHAAGLARPSGQMIAVREDVGRHNAVDKVLGWAAATGRWPASDLVLCVSGRVSFEIVQKAIVAGVSMIVAVSAPSSLAVDVAERWRVTLCGFVRGGRFNVYSHPARIASS